jgi:predicted AAA+ superfamily ATPase
MLIYRNLVAGIQNWLGRRDIIAIYGARQVGKTSLMRYLMDELAKKGERVIFIDLEDFELRELLNTPADLLRFLREKGIKEREPV